MRDNKCQIREKLRRSHVQKTGNQDKLERIQGIKGKILEDKCLDQIKGSVDQYGSKIVINEYRVLEMFQVDVKRNETFHHFMAPIFKIYVLKLE